MSTLLHDLHYAARRLLRSPGFTGVAVVTLALGIGATTAVFSLVNALLLQPPAGVHEPTRVVDLWGLREGQSGLVHSYPAYEDFRDHSASFEGLAVYGIRPLSVSTGEMSQRIFGFAVSNNYFDVLGTRPAAGRLFHPGDEQAVVLSHHLWERRFGADPAVVGETVLINGHPLVVVGVVEARFTGTLRGFGGEAWVPISLLPIFSREGQLAEGASWLHIVGRLGDGVTRDQAAAEVNALARRFAGEEGRIARPEAVVLTRVGELAGEARGAVIGVNALFVVLSVLVLVIAAANVSGMLLARTASRGREVAVRLAIGASRGRVVRQLLTETTLLFLIGGAVGMLAALGTARLLLSVPLPMDLPLHLDLSPDWRVFAFALLVALSVGLLFGLGPALRGSDLALGAALKDASPGGSPRTSRLRSAHVVAQVAFSLLLLITAGLFMRALQSAHAVEPGFDQRGVLTAGFDLEIQGYDPDRQQLFYEELLERAARLPGVEHASVARLIPLGLGTSTTVVQVDGEPVRNLSFNVVGVEYFTTMRIPLLHGREFTQRDRDDAPPVAIVNREFAERHWPAGAIGRQIEWGGRTYEVVGIVENSKHTSLGEPTEPFLYVPVFQQARNPELTLLLRTSGDPRALLPPLRREVGALDPHVPILNPAPLAEVTTLAVLPYRLAAGFTGMLGLLGLALASIGLYGVLAYAVAQRTREIGVRIAIGARQSEVLGMVVRRGFRLTVIGLGIGVLLAAAGTRLLAPLLFDVSPTDPLTFSAVIVLLLVVATAASYLPARRAARVDPMIALRAE